MAPGDSPPEKTAPAPLDLVQRFINSVDLEDGEDELSSPEALRDWLGERGLLGRREKAGRADLRRAVDVREGLRALLLEHNGVPLDESKVALLDAVAENAGVRMRFEAGAPPALVPRAPGVDGALGRLMAIVSEAVVAGTWQRLKACRRTECEWAFYDHSKNRSGRWCKMEDCGNLAKAAAFRERKRAS